MGRKRNIFLRDRFNYSIEKDESACKTCGAKFKGSHITNLKRHIITKHIELYNEEREQLIEDEVSLRNTKKHKFAIEISKNAVINACVELVVKEFQPLSFFDGQPFRILTEQMFTGLGVPPINSSNIMQFVNERNIYLKERIKKVIWGKLISLKIDVISWHDHTVLCITVQLIENKKILMYTLAMIELFKESTFENIREEIESVLNDFSITKNQIYSVTAVNGQNLIRPDELFSTSTISDTREYINMPGNEKSEELCEYIIQQFSLENIIPVKCAAHAIKLAVQDFFSENHKGVISRVHQVAKTLEASTLRYSVPFLQKAELELDVITCWNTYEMMECLLEYKKLYEENIQDSFKLSTTDWAEIEEIVIALAPLKAAALKLQKEQLCLSDFYKLWLILKFQLNDMDNKSAELILKSLKKIEKHEFENEIVSAALFLDPRLRNLLTEEKKEIAKKHLKHLAIQMLFLTQNNCEGHRKDIHLCESSISINKILTQSPNSVKLEIISSSDDDSSSHLFKEKLCKTYQEIEKYNDEILDMQSDLLEYWEEKKYEIPLLRKMTLVLQAVPVTQISVKGAFSALEIMSKDSFHNLPTHILKAIIFVNLNSNYNE